MAKFMQVVMTEEELKQALRRAYNAGFNEASNTKEPSVLMREQQLNEIVDFMQVGHKSDLIPEKKKK